MRRDATGRADPTADHPRLCAASPACSLPPACSRSRRPPPPTPLLPPRGQGLLRRHRREALGRTVRSARPATTRRCSASSRSSAARTSSSSAAPSRPDSRLMLHISTQDGYGTREVVTPRGDRPRRTATATWSASTAGSPSTGEPTYIRLMAEMNQANNGYAAFDRSGRSRGPSHSTAAFKQAWRRATLILRGGPVADDRREAAPARAAARRDRRRRAAAAADRDGVGAPDPRHAGHPRQHAARLLARRRATSTGSGPTSTAASRTSTGSTTSTATSPASRSCSANGRCGAPTTPAS